MHSRKVVVVVLVALLLAVVPVAIAAAQGIPEVDLIATEYAFEVPSELSAGPTRFVLRNQGAEIHHAQMFKLNEGATEEQVTAALQAGDVPGVLALVSGAGGPSVTFPGANSAAIVDLTPGTYMVTCFVETDEGVPHLALGMLSMFTVTEGDMAAAEVASDATVTLRDFAFDLPATINSGPQTWEVVNEGPQLHEIILFQVAEGMSAEDIVMLFEGEGEDEGDGGGEAEGPPPFSPAGGVQALSVGSTNWAALDLQPGSYIALCGIPDAETGKPHFELGMVASFTIEAETAPATMPTTGAERDARALIGWISLAALALLTIRALVIRAQWRSR